MITINIPSKDIKTDNMGEAIDTIEEQCRKLFKPDSITVRYNFEKEEYTLFVVNPTIKKDEKNNITHNTKSIDEKFVKLVFEREKQQSIQIEEATDDYYRAYKDYRKDEEVYTVQLSTILKLPENAEVTIMQNKGIAIHGLTSITKQILKEIQAISYNYYINLTSKDEITLIAYFKEDYIITEEE